MFAAIALAVTVVAAEPVTEPPRLTLYTENNPPFNFRSDQTGDITGVSYQIVIEMMRRAEIPYNVELLPWKRAFQLTQDTRNSCLFSMDFTEEREAKFQWVTPILESQWYFFSKPDAGIELKSLEDLEPYRISATDAYASTRELQALGHENILLAQTTEDALKLLYHGRVQLWLAGEIEAIYLSRKNGMPPPTPLLYLGTARSSMGCSLTTDPDLIEKLQQINKTMEPFKKAVLQQLRED